MSGVQRTSIASPLLDEPHVHPSHPVHLHRAATCHFRPSSASMTDGDPHSADHSLHMLDTMPSPLHHSFLHQHRHASDASSHPTSLPIHRSSERATQRRIR